MSYVSFIPKNILKEEGYRTALALAVGVFVYQFFRIPNGPWVILTLAIIYLAGADHSFITIRMNKKILGAVFGLIFGVSILGLFSYYNYYWLYLFTPAAFFLAFYTYFMSKSNYVYLTFFITIYLFLSYSITFDTNYDLPNAAFSRIFCAVIGLFILALVELLILPKSTRPKSTTIPIIETLIKDSSQITTNITSHFFFKCNLDDKFWSKVALIASELSAVEHLVHVIVFELNFISEYENYYSKIINSTNKMLSNIKNMSYMCQNQDCDILKVPEVFQEICENLTNLITTFPSDKSINKYFIEKLIDQKKYINKASCEYIFILNLHMAIKHLDIIREQLGNIKNDKR